MDELPAFPEGWYFVTSRESILREKLIEKTWLGEEIVAWCDEAGRVCVADAVCPHLGSYLGPEVGGQICNGRLVCPFHGFEYDTTGQCVATPNAPAPQSRETEGIPDQRDPWSGLRLVRERRPVAALGPSRRPTHRSQSGAS